MWIVKEATEEQIERACKMIRKSVAKMLGEVKE